MWLVLCAILLLFLLIFINKKKEGFNSAQLLDIYTILIDNSTDSEEKIKLLAEPSITINDSVVENIVKTTNFSADDKIFKIFAYLDELIDKRNNKQIYDNNERTIDSDSFFSVLKIIQSSEFDEDTEKILEIKKLGLIDDAFDKVINSDIPDSLKIINKDLPKLPSLQNLINEIIFPV